MKEFDLRDRVAEPVRARLRQALAAVTGVRGAVLAEAALLLVVEDQLQRLLADLLLTARGERVAVAVALDDPLVLELLAELIQIEPLVDEAAALQVFHPLQRLPRYPAAFQIGTSGAAQPLLSVHPTMSPSIALSSLSWHNQQQ